MFRLPASKISVELDQITGRQDMLLLESPSSSVRVSIALADSLVTRNDGVSLDASALPLSDLETLVLELRRMLLGDVIRSPRKCPVQGCDAETETSFHISEFLARNKPRSTRVAEPDSGEPGWFRLRSSAVKFRLVTAGDVEEVEELPNPEFELRRRTIQPDRVSGRDIARALAAMESLSPCLSQELEGRCPACGADARYLFEPLQYVHRELRYEAIFLYHDVHVLAARYHWSEEKILALPRKRRLQYAELASAGAQN